MAQFRIDNTFAIRSKKLFVFAGDVVQGTVRSGMVIHWPLSQAIGMVFRVHGVELGNRGAEGFVGLTYRVEVADEFERLEQLRFSGEIVEVRESGEPPQDLE